jgi:hypothetical protein
MVRTVVEDHMKQTLENEKRREQDQQISIERYEDLSSKLLNILS